MNRKYRNITSVELNYCKSEKANWIAFKQIAYNLAHIADELAELNRVNSKTISEVIEDLEAHGLKPEPKQEPKPEPKEDPAPGLEVELGKDSDPLHGKCFICGKPVDDNNVGGIIIDGDGAAYRACAKCKDRFDMLVDVFVMPNSIYC